MSRCLRSILFALATYALLNGPAAAAYPERIIKIVVPFAPGGGTDVVARTLAQEMAKDLGASVIIENKPGAGTIIGTQAVAASAPDGYTLLMGTFANAVNPSLNAKLPYDRAQGFRGGGADGAFLQHRRGQSGVPDQIDRRPDRGGKEPNPTNCRTAPTAPAPRRIWRANCSSTWPGST